MGAQRQKIRTQIKGLQAKQTARQRKPGWGTSADTALATQIRKLQEQLKGKPQATTNSPGKATRVDAYNAGLKKGVPLAALKAGKFDLIPGGTPQSRAFIRASAKAQSNKAWGMLSPEQQRGALTAQTSAGKQAAARTAALTPAGEASGGYTKQNGGLYQGGKAVTDVAGVPVSKLVKGHGDLLKGGSAEQRRQIRLALKALGISR